MNNENIENVAKICAYCNAPLPQYSSYCFVCKAKIPRAKAKEYEIPGKTAGNDIEIPEPGSIIGELIEVTTHVLDGNLAPEDLVEQIPEIRENILSIFTQMAEELTSISSEAKEYGNFILDLLSFISSLFDMGLAEMEVTKEDQDLYHLKFGIFLLQRAEAEYIELLKTLKNQSNMDNFASEKNIVAVLASRLHNSLEDPENYKQILIALRNSLNYKVGIGWQHVDTALNAALTYDGNNDDVIKGALAEIEAGVHEFSTVITNLYDVDATEEEENQQ